MAAGTPISSVRPDYLQHRPIGVLDLGRIAVAALGARRLRTGLTALGIAIGIAALVAVIGISESSRADLLATLDRLGTNLLTVTPGRSISGERPTLPERASSMIARIGPVQRVGAVEALGVTVRRTDLIPAAETGGIAVIATDAGLLPVLGADLAAGRTLDSVMERYPTVLLGSVAAVRLGLAANDVGNLVDVGGKWFTVIGILKPLPLSPEIDRSALIGLAIAEQLFGATGSPTTIYVRVSEGAIADVRSVLPATVNPADPTAVAVSRPSEVLAAKAAATSTFISLFLGLGAVALLVGGLGIANVMLMAALERRSEIGLRRALGATRSHIIGQFLTEAVLIAGLGGALGAGLGCLVTVAYASSQGWLVAIPWTGVVSGLALTVAIGAVAGLYSAVCAARTSPTESLRAA